MRFVAVHLYKCTCNLAPVTWVFDFGNYFLHFNSSKNNCSNHLQSLVARPSIGTTGMVQMNWSDGFLMNGCCLISLITFSIE